MNNNVKTGTDATFQQMVLSSEVPVLVDFWAPWCAPCRLVGPVLDEIANEYEGKAKVVKINVDEQQMVAGQMGVRSIPTIALFNNGKVEEVMVGARPKREFASALDKAIQMN